MGKTSIEWTDESSNPLKVRRLDGKPGWYCRKISSGCTNCYASTMNVRNGTNPGRHGTGHDFRLNEAVNLEPWLNERELKKIAGARKPRRWFVCDMTDVCCSVYVCQSCGKAHEDEDRAGAGVNTACCRTCDEMAVLKFWSSDMIQRCLDAWFEAAMHGMTIQILTKRPRRLRLELESWRAGAGLHSLEWPIPGWHIGVSAEDQKRWDERVPELLRCPAAVRFVSAEPLLGPIDVSRHLWPACWHWDGAYRTHQEATAAGAFAEQRPQSLVHAEARFVDQIIIGGESGPGARPCSIGWIKSIRDQCKATRAACFVKQLGSKPSVGASTALLADPNYILKLRDKKGGEMDEWPEDLRIREQV